MKKLWRNRKGIAIEMAITTMLVVFALSTILLVVAQLTGVLNRRTEQNVGDRIAVDAIGEAFWQAQRQETDFDETAYSDYTVAVEDIAGGKRLNVKSKDGTTSLLLVETTGTGSVATIVKWGR